MERFQGLKLKLPPVGSSGNWGSAINKNFLIINDEINTLYQRVQQFASLLGNEIPYIKTDERQFFVVIQQVTDNVKKYDPGSVSWRLSYFPKKEDVLKDGKVDMSKTTASYEYTKQTDGFAWVPAIPNFLAAYILSIGKITKGSTGYGAFVPNEEIKLESIDVFGNTAYKKSDLMVRSQSFGSIYGDYSVVTFKKYPPMGEYYRPMLASGTPYTLEYEKQTYVDNFFDEKNSKYTLPSIGMGTFLRYEFKKSTEWENTLNGNSNPDNITIESEQITFHFDVADGSQLCMILEPQIQWYIKADGSGAYEPVFIGFSYESESQSGITTYTITVDTSAVELGETIKADIYFTHNGFTLPNTAIGASIINNKMVISQIQEET
jgi:hypothetical protein